MQHDEQLSLEVERDLQALVVRLRSSNPYHRRRARRRLRRAGAIAVEPLLALLGEETRIRSSQRTQRFGLAALVGCGYVWWAFHLAEPRFWPLALALFLPLFALLRLKAASRAQIEAIQLLAELNDVRAVGLMAEALEYREMWQISGIGWIAPEVLCRLLPQVRAEDAALLNEQQRVCLYHVLTASVPQHPHLAVAILDALTRIGDPRALPYMQRLAFSQPSTLSGKQICETARECLVALQFHLESQRAPKTLLRAASADNASHILLHPAGNLPTAPEELLRSTAIRQHEDE